MNSDIWNPVRSQADIEYLLMLFGSFHDSCLREAHVWTDHYVNSDLSMHCSGDLDTRIRLLIQRQFKEPSAIELFFEQVIAFHVQLSPANNDSIIFQATMLRDDDSFYCADTGGWSPKSAGNATWIRAKKLLWRDAGNSMGGQLRYAADSTVPAN